MTENSNPASFEFNLFHFYKTLRRYWLAVTIFLALSLGIGWAWGQNSQELFTVSTLIDIGVFPSKDSDGDKIRAVESPESLILNTNALYFPLAKKNATLKKGGEIDPNSVEAVQFSGKLQGHFVELVNVGPRGLEPLVVAVHEQLIEEIKKNHNELIQYKRERLLAEQQAVSDSIESLRWTEEKLRGLIPKAGLSDFNTVELIAELNKVITSKHQFAKSLLALKGDLNTLRETRLVAPQKVMVTGKKQFFLKRLKIAFLVGLAGSTFFLIIVHYLAPAVARYARGFQMEPLGRA